MSHPSASHLDYELRMAEFRGGSATIATYPAAKKVLLDKYAEIALFDANENDRHIDGDKQKAAAVKSEQRAYLDEQIRVKQAALLKERAQEKEWVDKEKVRVAIWNGEEKKKIAESKVKQERLQVQRQQQLREQEALRIREAEEDADYDQMILRDIKKHILAERAVEVEKRKKDEEALQRVKEQNIEYEKMRHVRKAKEHEAVRALEAQWSEVIEKQERQRARLLAQTYARQARQYAASASMQEIMAGHAKEDEARALRVQNEIEAAKIKREQDAIDRRKALQKECLEVLEIQIREKAQRKQQMSQRDALVIEREQLDLKRAEEAEQRARANRASLNAEHAKHLAEQIQLQATRKTLEPFLMSKAERQMNAAILRRLPS